MAKTFIKKDEKYQRLYCDGMRCVVIGGGRSFKLVGFIETPEFPPEEDTADTTMRHNPNNNHLLLFEITLPPRAILDLQASLGMILQHMKGNGEDGR